MAAGRSAHEKLVEALFAWSVLLFVGAAMVLLAIEPEAIAPGIQQPVPRAVVHLLTLGGVLSAFYLLQNRLWGRLYGRTPVLPWLLLLVWASHVTGVVLLAAGFRAGSPLAAQVGGHYLVPLGIFAAFAQGIATAARRPAGTPRHLAAHLPGLGLLVTMGLGAMMVLDAYGGGYGIYTPHTILVHVASGGFLFFLPFVLCQESAREAGAPQGMFSATALLLFPVGAAGAGVLAVALSGLEPGWSPALPVGLALLGGVALWVGLPAFGMRKPPTFPALRRSLWSALGVLLLFAAIRAGGGMEAAEARELMRFAVTLFLFAVALPDLLTRLGPPPPSSVSTREPQAGEDVRAAALLFVALLVVAGLMLAAQLAGSAVLVRIAAGLALGALAWQGWRLLQARRG